MASIKRLCLKAISKTMHVPDLDTLGRPRFTHIYILIEKLPLAFGQIQVKSGCRYFAEASLKRVEFKHDN
jgi:hypothetical protein